ncbi:MAG: hypothetical protein HY744_23515 [Deltaproteobacteria bacterium]|nr:hypothetical protein [Deltaproteobacteria bacterium]
MLAIEPDIDKIYEEHIRDLPAREQLRLLAVIAERVAQSSRPDSKRTRLTDLEGVGAEVWTGVDAQAYVDELRAEWDRRP